MSHPVPDDADPPPEAAPAPRWLFVRVAGSTRALPGDEVVAISDPRPLTRLPGAPPQVLGLLNHRGSVVTAVDLGLSLGGAKSAVEGYRLVLVNWRGHVVAVAASDVLGFGEQLAPPSVTEAGVLDLDVLFQATF